MDSTTFESLGLEPTILEALNRKGFQEPTPIQALAIPRLLSGSVNLVARARTGTGKTAAFGLPLIQKLKEPSGAVRALVLVPTRELALQVTEEIASLRPCGEYPRIAPVYGGAPYGDQFRRLARGVEIVVGTPGRVKDHIDRGSLDLSALEFFVLDEADEMLDMGFLEDIEWIFEKAPEDRRVLMFSATMPKEILRIARKRLGDYEIVADESGPVQTNLTDQIWLEVREADKLEVLSRLIDIQDEFYGIVFCSTKVDADGLARSLSERGYGAEALHGDLSQTERERVLGRFRSRRTTILTATDVAARGIDIDRLTHVVNFALPNDPDSYTHRIGRTGRAGNTGTAVTFVTPEDSRRVFFLSKATGGALKKGAIPEVEQVLDAKRSRIRAKVMSCAAELGLPSDPAGDPEAKADDGASEALGRWRCLATELLENLSPEDALAAALAAGYGPELDPGRYRPIKAGAGDSSRIFIGTGRRDGADRRAVAQLVKDLGDIPDRMVGGVEVYDAFSFVTVPMESAERIILAARKSGKGLVVKMAFPKDGERGRHGRPFHKGQPRRDGGKYAREGYSPYGRGRAPRTAPRPGWTERT
jgi:ATP-dependent RNA helicase DeaD